MSSQMAFFRGGLRGEGAHDDLARQIADAGRDWAQNYFVSLRFPEHVHLLMLRVAMGRSRDVSIQVSLFLAMNTRV